jgi:hypothetical protein
MAQKKKPSSSENIARKNPSAKVGIEVAPKKARKADSAIAIPEPPNISIEEVAKRAYALWESRGRPLGSPDEDWHKAIEEIRAGL